MLWTWFNGTQPQWTLPGGGVEYGEALEEAVVREVREEAGYDVTVGRPLTTHLFSVLPGRVRRDRLGPSVSCSR